MPLTARLRRPRPLVAGAAVLAVALAAIALIAVPGRATSAAAATDIVVDVPGPDPVRLDAALYRPATTPAPAVLVAHGFDGSKTSVTAEAHELAARGFVVLAYTARGFGASTGEISLNAPESEVADARYLLDWLAQRPEVVTDAPGDPRVGVTGASYGGALALLLAGYDDRVDALVPVITWNDLGQALFPNAQAGTAPTPAPASSAPDGVFKAQWAGRLYGAGLGSPVGPDGLCGRFRDDVCRAYTQAATTGRSSPALADLLRRASPVTVTDRITAPTLLVQGSQDTLFGLDQADATARQLAAAGAPVSVAWYAGGHDGGPPGPRLRERIGQWFDHHLRGIGEDPGTGFEYQVQGAFGTGEFAQRTVTAPAYPGLDGEPVQRRSLALQGREQQVVRPPGANPAALSSLPGLGGVLSQLGGAVGDVGAVADPPGQSAMFLTAALADPLEIAGAPRLRLQLAAAGSPPPTEAVLFVKLVDVGPDGSRVLPGSAVAPVRVGPLPADGTAVRVDVTLAGIVRPVEAGHRLAVTVATTDRAYAMPTEPAAFTVAVDGALTVPLVPGEQAPAAVPVAQLAGLGGLALLVGAIALGAALRRRHPDDADPALANVPLMIRGLGKRYPGAIVAVDDVSFRVERGQVLGLLGPNGAGKTTALRMLMGLLTPTAGEIRVFGHRVSAGAPVLSRIGSFVEGSGFLPHLSGAENLRLYWAATGRPAETSRSAEALEIAGLGAAVHRRVGTYSQGMRQRLAIAQAMLGMPDLLVLDEPTNGLDPPQISAMRDVLRGYAAGGRTVLVSSHLLAEVEQTCTHVVVMHRGRLVAAGTVADIVSGGGEASFTVGDPTAAADVLRGLDGVCEVTVEGASVHAHLNGTPRADAVSALVGAGVPVTAVGSRRGLEDAFLHLVEQR
ncbi:MAG: alpha/beta fold hydrolase [Pseudonocardiaceae bacterium]